MTTRMRGLSHLMASDLGWVSVSRDATDVLRGHLEVARQEGTEGCSLQRVGPLTPRVAGTVLSVLSDRSSASRARRFWSPGPRVLTRTDLSGFKFLWRGPG